MSFLALSQLWLAALALPLVAIYFLKLKRPRQTVPSLLLWARVLDDERVNSPLQRFRRHLLLWLQLAVLACLVLAALQPVWRGGAEAATRLVAIVDCSASMAARAQPGGPTRLQLAQEALRQAIAELPRGRALALVAMSDRARRVTDFTDNRRELLAAVDDLQVADVAGDAEAALRLAQGLQNDGALDEVWMLTDGNLPEQVDADLGAELRYQLLLPATANLGLGHCQARRRGERWQLLVQVVSASGGGSGQVRLVSDDGVELGRSAVACQGNDRQRLLFDLPPGDAGRFTIRLQPDGFDGLASDDEIRFQLRPPRPVRAWVAGRLDPWRAALAARADVDLVDDAADADLVVAEELPAQPPALLCTVGWQPPAAAPLIEQLSEGDQIIDWTREQPLLRWVSFDDVLLAESRRWRHPAAAEELAAAGWRTCVHGSRGPVALLDGEARHLAWLVPTRATTLPYRVGFPVLVANLVGACQTRLGLTAFDPPSTGAVALADLPPEQPVRVTDPAGTEQTYHSDARGRLASIAADRVGRYRVAAGGAARLVDVSLQSPQESSLSVSPALQFRESRITASREERRGDRSLWWWAAAAALALLAGEWWFFQQPLRGRR